jgi:F-type H+-transporting ATPase subunit b
MTAHTPELVPLAPNSADSAQVGTTTHASTEAAHEGGGGLPQFEFQHWFGQIVYLIFLFAILYWLIAKVFAPRMRRVFDERETTISTAVATARQVQAEAAGQAEAAKAEVEKARADSRAASVAAKARVTDAANARAEAEEAIVNARIAEAETAIGKTRDAAMANVATIAADTASAIVERLTGKAPTAAEAAAAVKGAA